MSSTATCTVALGGTVQSSTSVTISSGSISPCDTPPGAFSITPSFDWIQQVGTGITISNVRFTLTYLPSNPLITCIYEGALSGTRTTGASSVLTITSDTLVKAPGSSPVCSADPRVRGTLSTNLTIT